MVTHAHIMLLGFVTSFIYGVCYKLWIPNPSKKIAIIQFTFHHAGSILMLSGLILIYGKIIPENKIEPVMAISSVAVIFAIILMIYQLLANKAE